MDPSSGNQLAKKFRGVTFRPLDVVAEEDNLNTLIQNHDVVVRYVRWWDVHVCTCIRMHVCVCMCTYNGMHSCLTVNEWSEHVMSFLALVMLPQTVRGRAGVDPST